MNWDAIGAVGELVGASGVIISVAYLAIQIKKQTAEARLAATRELAAQHQDGLKLIAADPALSKIYLKAIRDYRSLPDEEKVRISIVFNDIFRNTEQRYLHTKSGHIEGSYLESINKVVVLFLSYPGVREWWLTSTHGFDTGFVSYIAERIGEAETLQVESTFGDKNGSAT